MRGVDLLPKQFPQFEAALCLLPVLPPDKAVALLRDCRSRLKEKPMHMQAELKDILGRTFVEVAGADEELPAPLLGLKFPAILVVENDAGEGGTGFRNRTGTLHHRRRGPSLFVARYASRPRASISARE